MDARQKLDDGARPSALAWLLPMRGWRTRDINVGVTLSATGPAASLGIPEKNTFELLPTSIGGERSTGSSSTTVRTRPKAVTNTRKLISEDKVDVVIGSTITPNSLAMSTSWPTPKRR
jgi:branched-chain amino acid transport system substrate-binding protein